MRKQIFLSTASKLENYECREFSVVVDSDEINLFLVSFEGELYCYRNSCPHTGAMLNWLPNQFWNTSKDYLHCTLHGALFEARSGLCRYGPCLGEHLEQFDITTIEGAWYLQLG